MPSKQIAVGQELTIQTPAFFLSIINTNSQFSIEAPDFGVLAGKVGRQYELPDTDEVVFINTGDTIVDVEYEVANIKVHGAGNGTVTVENAIVVKRIEEGLSFEATVSTIDDGKVRLIPANVINVFDDVTIQPNSKKLLIAENDQTNRVVALQNISAQVTSLRIGSTFVSASKGNLIRGSIDAIGSTEIANAAEIWAYNDSDTEATVSVVEEFRP